MKSSITKNKNNQQHIPECPICKKPGKFAFNNKSWILDGVSKNFQYCECAVCDLLFCTPLPTKQDINKVYNEYFNYDWYVKHRILKIAQASHRYKRIKSIFKTEKFALIKNKLLDIGCGHAWFLKAAQKDGWDVSGVEHFDDKLLQNTIQHDIKIYNTSIENLNLPKNTYDLITMWHVLEHCRNPKRILSNISELMTNNGYCIIAVPNKNSKGLAKDGLSWGWLQPPFVHLFCFSLTSLKKILPANLSIIFFNSRDTWDKQYIESTLIFKIYDFIIRLLFRAPHKICNRLSLRMLANIFDKIHFVFYRTALLTSYAFYILFRPLLKSYEKNLRGSELLIILQKPANRQGK